ncbi:MAG: 30S ribosomal protein S3, partial [Stackebrandtia sp.]
ESARIAMTRHIKRGGKVWIYKGDGAEAAQPQEQVQRRREGGGRGGDRRGRVRSGASGTTATGTEAGRAASGARNPGKEG